MGPIDIAVIVACVCAVAGVIIRYFIKRSKASKTGGCTGCCDCCKGCSSNVRKEDSLDS